MLKRRPNRNLLVIAGLGISLALAMPVYAQTASDCAARAERAARNTTGAVGGAVVGAAGGAATAVRPVRTRVAASRALKGVFTMFLALGEIRCYSIV